MARYNMSKLTKRVLIAEYIQHVCVSSVKVLMQIAQKLKVT